MRAILPVSCFVAGIVIGVFGSLAVMSPEEAGETGKAMLANMGLVDRDVSISTTSLAEDQSEEEFSEIEVRDAADKTTIQVISKVLGRTFQNVEEAIDALLAEVDATGAHPKDPLKPASVPGVSDEELIEAPEQKIVDLVTLAAGYAEQSDDSARYLFELGRMAFLHYYDENAYNLLLLAADRGSSAAYMYLSEFVEVDQAKSFLELSVEGGFEPARELLAQYEEDSATENHYIEEESSREPEPVDFSKFSRPDYIQAFHDSDFSGLPDNMLYTLTYVTAVLENLDTDSTLFMQMDVELRTLVEPELTHMAQRKLLGTREGLRETTSAGLESLFGPLVALAENRRATQYSGGSFMDAIEGDLMSMNQAILESPTVRLELEKKKGAFDARKLMVLYSSNKQAVLNIYEGMKSYILQ